MGYTGACVNCYGYANCLCSVCQKALCYDCNLTLNTQREDAQLNDGKCWTCREEAAGTYIGEEIDEES